MPFFISAPSLEESMHKNSALCALSKEELLSLLEIYAKNWLAMDGVWFQSIEQKLGMDEAIYHDEQAWRRRCVCGFMPISTMTPLRWKGIR